MKMTTQRCDVHRSDEMKLDLDVSIDVMIRCSEKKHSFQSLCCVKC